MKIEKNFFKYRDHYQTHVLLTDDNMVILAGDLEQCQRVEQYIASIVQRYEFKIRFGEIV